MYDTNAMVTGGCDNPGQQLTMDQGMTQTQHYNPTAGMSYPVMRVLQDDNTSLYGQESMLYSRTPFAPVKEPEPSQPLAGMMMTSLEYDPTFPKRRPYTEIDFDESFDEEVDEEFSDEDMVEDNMAFVCTRDDVTQQLLKFADNVNVDIQKYFGRKKGDDESCDIYEEKWNEGKSGRELYYADLLRIAQGGDDADDRPKRNNKKGDSGKNSKSKSCGTGLAREEEEADTVQYSGRLDPTVGLGPLGELFQVGLKDFVEGRHITRLESRRPSSSSAENNQARKVEDALPMTKRNFPLSFWQEPIPPGQAMAATGITPLTDRDKVHSALQSGGAVSVASCQPAPTLLSGCKAPDFSDLLESWTRVYDNGEIPPAELVAASVVTECTSVHRA